jgi:hypothetical protein
MNVIATKSSQNILTPSLMLSADLFRFVVGCCGEVAISVCGSLKFFLDVRDIMWVQQILIRRRRKVSYIWNAQYIWYTFLISKHGKAFWIQTMNASPSKFTVHILNFVCTLWMPLSILHCPHHFSTHLFSNHVILIKQIIILHGFIRFRSVIVHSMDVIGTRTMVPIGKTVQNKAYNLLVAQQSSSNRLIC